MKKGTHGKDEKKFSELDPHGESRVINSQIQGLLKSINANLKKINASNKLSATEKRDKINARKAICINQLADSIKKINKMPKL